MCIAVSLSLGMHYILLSFVYHNPFILCHTLLNLQLKYHRMRSINATNKSIAMKYTITHRLTHPLLHPHTIPYLCFLFTSGRPLPYEFGPRREGDIAMCYADPTKVGSSHTPSYPYPALP